MFVYSNVNGPRLSAKTSTKMIKLQNYFMSERYDYSYRNNPNQSIVVCLLRKNMFVCNNY